DHENVYRARGRLEFQAELLLQGGAYGWPVIDVRGLAGRTYGIRDTGESVVHGELQMKRESPCESGIIDYFLAKDQGELLYERRHGHADSLHGQSRAGLYQTGATWRSRPRLSWAWRRPCHNL